MKKTHTAVMHAHTHTHTFKLTHKTKIKYSNFLY